MHLCDQKKRQENIFLPFLLNIVLEVLVKAISKEKEAKDTQIGKKDIKLYLFLYDVILCAEVHKQSTKSVKTNK